MEKLEKLFEVHDKKKMILIITVAALLLAKTAVEALSKAE